MNNVIETEWYTFLKRALLLVLFDPVKVGLVKLDDELEVK